MTWAAKAHAPETRKLREIFPPKPPPSRATSTVTLTVEKTGRNPTKNVYSTGAKLT